MNYSKIIIIFIIFFISVLSCKENQKKSNILNLTKELVPISVDSLNKLKEDAIYNGDTVAYEEIFSEYLMMNKGQDFLLYALIMSNKNKYSKASFDVYFILTDGKNKDSLKTSLDSSTYKLALDYLNKAANQGDKSAIDELKWLSN